ncbi:hypothetical protein Tco_1082244 [Tanacetum coccineum]|uniref:Uncharacterized protein n=1 Tax=Tanacetum coccineum TaxID=301880 RepID=A0ABQ5HZX4_9ASTR
MSDSQNSLREIYKTDVIPMSTSLSKSLKELKEELIEEVHEMLNIFKSMEQKVNGRSPKENILQNEIDRLLKLLKAELEKSSSDSNDIQANLLKRIKILENDFKRSQAQSIDFELKLQHQKEKMACDVSWKSKLSTINDENVLLKTQLDYVVKERENIKLEYQKLFNSIKATRNQHQKELDELIEHVNQKTYAYADVRVESSNSVRRPKSKDTKSKDRVLKNNNDKRLSTHVRKMSSSVSIDTNKRETMYLNVCQSNASALSTKTVNAVNDGSNIACVSCGKDAFLLSHEKCVAHYALSRNSSVKRALFTTHIVAKSKNLGATSIVAKSRLSVAKTPTATNKVSSVLPLSSDFSQSRTLIRFFVSDLQLRSIMDDPNIIIEEYIGLEEEKAQRHGQTFNWQTATYGKMEYCEDKDVSFTNLETEYPSIVFDYTSDAALSCEPTVSPLDNNEIDFKISFDESDDEDYMIWHLYHLGIRGTHGSDTRLRDMARILYTATSIGSGDSWEVLDGSEKVIPDKGDLKDYWIEISSDRDFLGPAPSYVFIRDLVTRLCHRMIACSISGWGQAPKKVTGVDLFYLRSMDRGTSNVSYLLAQYLFRHTEGRKSGGRMSGRQTDAATGAPEAAEDAPATDKGAQADLAPVQAPQLPPPAPRTIQQRVSGLRGDVVRSITNQSRFATWMVSCMNQLMDASGRTYQAFDSTLVGSSQLPYQRRTRRRTDGASTSAPQQPNP